MLGFSFTPPARGVIPHLGRLAVVIFARRMSRREHKIATYLWFIAELTGYTKQLPSVIETATSAGTTNYM